MRNEIGAAEERGVGGSRPRRGLLLAARWLLLPVSLWLVATLFLRGDLGKWNDDYFFLGQFDPATGQVKSYTLDRTLHFWRPVYRYVATPLITALFEHDQVLHIISATVHGLSCVLLYRLMRRLHLGRIAAGLASMLMLVWPAHHEVAFWNTCNFTAVATCGCLVWTWAYMNWLERRRPRDGAWLPVWTMPPIMGGLGFLVAATNEQPVAAALALPILGLLFTIAPANEAADASIRRSGGRVQALLRAAAPVALTACGAAVYLIVQMRRFPPFEGHTTGATVPSADLGQRISGLVAEIGRNFALTGWRSDALALGWHTLAREWILGLAAGVIVVIGAAWWIRAACEPSSVDHRAAPPAWRVGLIVFGVAWFVACWVPIARIYYPASPRLFYAPLAGLAIAIAAVLDLVMGARPELGTRRAAVSAACILLMLPAAVMMVAIQRGYQARWRADLDQARQLVELVPSPPRNAIFVPVRVVDKVSGEERSRFTQRYQPPLHSSWAAGWWLQMAYKRNDVAITQAIGPWDRAPLEALPARSEGNPRGRARLINPLAPPKRAAARFGAVSWDRIVPFEIDGEGRVRVFGEALIEWADTPPTVVEFSAAGGVGPERLRLVVRGAAGARSP